MIGFYAAGAMGHGSGPPPSGWNAAVAALPGLWGWWKLDETAGPSVTAADSSGNGRHGTYNAAGSQTSGLFAGSIVAQESLGSSVSLPSYTTPATPKLTLGAFIQTTAGAGEQQILSADGGGSRIWQFCKRSTTGTLELTLITPSVVAIYGSTPINDGNPHLVIMVFDQSLAAGDGRAKLYLDGVLDGASTTAITISSGISNTPGIGARRGSDNTGLWSGAMDEAFMCTDAISSADVAALWAARNS